MIPIMFFAVALLASVTVGYEVSITTGYGGFTEVVFVLKWWTWFLASSAFVTVTRASSSKYMMNIGIAGYTVSAVQFFSPKITVLPAFLLWVFLSLIYIAVSGKIVQFVITQWYLIKGTPRGINPSTMGTATGQMQGKSSEGSGAKGHDKLPELERYHPEQLRPERIAKPTADPTGRIGLDELNKRRRTAADEEVELKRDRERRVLLKPDAGAPQGPGKDRSPSVPPAPPAQVSRVDK